MQNFCILFLTHSLDKKEKTAEEEVAEDVEQIVAFLKETDPANKIVHETPAPQGKFLNEAFLLFLLVVFCFDQCA